MATNKMRPIHPGEIIREEYLLPLQMTPHALAMALRVPSPRINDIVRERRAVSPDTALRRFRRTLAVDQHRQLAVREHLVGFAADQQPGDAAAAVRRHENQVAFALLRCLYDRLIGRIVAGV